MYKILLENICGICTDGAVIMHGYQSGFQSLVHNESIKVVATHSVIRRKILTAKTLPHELQDEMNKMPLTLLKPILDTLDCKNLLSCILPTTFVFYYSEARWLSRGKF
ncbi:Protein ZBED8 [Thelohanellus kitauei]|uniref:Protein ZBED8 n=1 Tax=Thelohanellus kitauei TaxID=669202 RepID=A0A0C2JLS1_THEKT|nr:Protein ZBED8 [Thelohanellus kitauei]